MNLRFTVNKEITKSYMFFLCSSHIVCKQIICLYPLRSNIFVSHCIFYIYHPAYVNCHGKLIYIYCIYDFFCPPLHRGSLLNKLNK
ncbi:hypothetical protein C0J52_17028 [Blattella germanica]|nr:hypothetical protein C0J52_17028 [Blattella germanica]